MRQVHHQLAKDKLDMQCDIKRSSEFFTEVVFEPENILTHWAVDTPVKLEPLVFSEEYGISIESELDIGCNKISAFYDRWSVKDMVDLYFLEKDGYPFAMLYERAQEKHAGLDDYWMAVALSQVNKVTTLPRMIKKVTVEELREHFLKIAKKLAPKEEPGG